MEEAKLMIDKCKELGLFASKFQLFTEKEAPNLPKQLYLTKEQAKELFEYGKGIGQEVFFTPMFPEAVDWCEEIGVKYYKVRFHDRKNDSIIQKMLDTRKLIFISSNYNPGLQSCWYINDPFCRLYCIPEYPATLEAYDNIPFGYSGISDHTSTLDLLRKWLNHKFKDFQIMMFEKHVCLTKECIEAEWSVTFEELAEVLK